MSQQGENSSYQFGTWHLGISRCGDASVKIARQDYEMRNAEERQVDQVVSDFNRCGTKVDDVQETKKFGRVRHTIRLGIRLVTI